MEIFSLDQHCCSTCRHWEGARILGECQHIYAMREIPGCCRMRREQTVISDSCTGWGLLHIAPDEPEIAYGYPAAKTAQARHGTFRLGFSAKCARRAEGLPAHAPFPDTRQCGKIGEINLAALRLWLFSWTKRLKKARPGGASCTSTEYKE